MSMNPQQQHQQQQNPIDPDQPLLPTIKIHHPSSPRHSHHHSSSSSTPATATSGARRKIGVAVDLSDESAYAVRWTVHHYFRPGDAVILLHVSPTSVLFGADWGPLPLPTPTTQTPTAQFLVTEFNREIDNSGRTLHRHEEGNNHHTQQQQQKKQQLEEDFDAFTASKVADLAKPLREAQIPYKTHIVKDHDMKERLCLEVERLGLSAVIMGSRGFGAAKRGSDGRLGSVSDYCVHHCVCPVVVVRYPEDKDVDSAAGIGVNEAVVKVNVPETEEEEEELEEQKEANR